MVWYVLAKTRKNRAAGRSSTACVVADVLCSRDITYNSTKQVEREGKDLSWGGAWKRRFFRTTNIPLHRRQIRRGSTYTK